MSKQDSKYQKIEELKENYRKLSTEQILKRLSLGISIKESSIAYKEVLKERNVNPDVA
ncbi:hypothetical protein [Gracilimonas sp.]|uniref:hypothetical protein n=1 Tax=Gracilimonas sp. TaxID=1974203 RepID=UPI003BAB05BF